MKELTSQVKGAVEQLKKVNAKILGSVMNRVNAKKSAGYGGYYGVDDKW